MCAPSDDTLESTRLAAHPAIAGVEHHASIGSTQDRATELARIGGVALPRLVVAEEQTAGRGRGANRWWTGRGSLAFSLLWHPDNWNLPREPMPDRALAVGVAIVETLKPLVPRDVPVGLHWPNDVYAGGKKIAGILVDVLSDGQHVIGVGLNVNNSLAAAPDDVRARATSLIELAGHAFDRTVVLLDLLTQLRTTLVEHVATPEHFGRRYNELCLQHGRTLTIDVAGRQTTGACAGIAPDGALLLETADGSQRFYSGVLR